MVTEAWRAFCFRLSNRCQVRQPKADADFMGLVDRAVREGLTIEQAEADWKAILLIRANAKKPGKLGDWAEDWKDCTRCTLSRCRKSVVMGRGPVPADIIVIGEAPGEQEDAQGEPFVGPSGVLLNRALRIFEQHDLTCYVTNLVGCRPPGNARPTSPQVDRCKDRLIATIRNVRPVMGLLVGTTAMQELLDLRTLSKHRGNVYWWEEVDLACIPTWHPSAILRDEEKGPQMMAELRADIEKTALRAKDCLVVPF